MSISVRCERSRADAPLSPGATADVDFTDNCQPERAEGLVGESAGRLHEPYIRHLACRNFVDPATWTQFIKQAQANAAKTVEVERHEAAAAK
jgi:hypothetical protein